jgi:hypothetical protein
MFSSVKSMVVTGDMNGLSLERNHNVRPPPNEIEFLIDLRDNNGGAEWVHSKGWEHLDEPPDHVLQSNIYGVTVSTGRRNSRQSANYVFTTQAAKANSLFHAKLPGLALTDGERADAEAERQAFHIRKLRLARNNIQGPIPASIQKLTHLKVPASLILLL